MIQIFMMMSVKKKKNFTQFCKAQPIVLPGPLGISCFHICFYCGKHSALASDRITWESQKPSLQVRAFA